MLPVTLAIRFDAAALLHGGHSPLDDWLQILAPGIGFVALAVAGFALYQYLKTRQPGLPDERAKE